MKRYRIAYTINGTRTKTKSINAKNERALKNKLKKNYTKKLGIKIIDFEEICSFKYGLFNDVARKFVEGIEGNTPQDVIRNAFRIMGNEVRKYRYRVKPLDLNKEEQRVYNQQCREFDMKYKKEI